MKIFENGDYILFNENVICFVISVIDILCQFSCERIEDLRALIRRIQVMSVARVNCKRMEELFKEGL